MSGRLRTRNRRASRGRRQREFVNALIRVAKSARTVADLNAAVAASFDVVVGSLWRADR